MMKKFVFSMLFVLINFVLSSTIEENFENLKKFGIPITPEELIIEIPDEENGALIYQESFKILSNLDEKYRELMDYLPFTGIKKWEEISEEKKKEVSDLILKNPDFVKFYKTLEKATEMKCQFLKKEDLKDYIKFTKIISGQLLSVFTCFRASARLLCDRAKIEVENGNFNNALKNILITLKLSKSLSYIPLLFSQLTRLAIDTIAIRKLEEILNYASNYENGDLNLYKEIISEIKKEREEEICLIGLKGEVILARGLFSYLKEQKGEEGKILGISTEIFTQDHLKKEEITYLETIQKLIPILKKPYYLGYKEMENFERDLSKISNVFSTKGLQGVYTRAYLQEAQTDTLLGTTEITILIILYKKKYGKYPDTLENLFPEFAEKLPIDPFTGKNYFYKKEKEGFKIYSLGPNSEDNDGVYKAGDKKLDDISFEIKK